MPRPLYNKVYEKYKKDGFVELIGSGLDKFIFHPFTDSFIYPYVDKKVISNKELKRMCCKRDDVWEYSTTIDLSFSFPNQDNSDKYFNNPREGIDFSPRCVCELPNATLLAPWGLVRTESGNWVLESAKHPFFIKNFTREKPIQLLLKSLQLDSNITNRSSYNSSQYDRVMSMVNHSNQGNYQYGHWLVEYLPKLLGLSIYEKRTGNKPDILLSNNPPKWVVKSLQLLGYGKDRILEWTTQSASIDNLILPITSRNHGDIKQNSFSPIEHQWLQTQFRDAADSDSHSDQMRIFASRQGFDNRSIDNFEQVRPILEEYNFTIIRPEELDFVEQLNLYAKSSIILGVRGSSLHSMIFAQDADICEIFPPAGHTAQNYVLANGLGHTYWYLTGEMRRESVKTTYGYIPFQVDPEAFQTWIDQVVENSK